MKTCVASAIVQMGRSSLESAAKEHGCRTWGKAKMSLMITL
jgi:hypothetical protein